MQHYGTLGTSRPRRPPRPRRTGIAADETTLTDARTQIAALRAEPALRTQPGDVLDVAHAGWATDREQAAAWQATLAAVEREHRATPCP